MENLKMDKTVSSELIYRVTDTIIILGILILASVYSPQYNSPGYLAAGLVSLLAIQHHWTLY